MKTQVIARQQQQLFCRHGGTGSTESATLMFTFINNTSAILLKQVCVVTIYNVG
jgi:hypothetical protein